MIATARELFALINRFAEENDDPAIARAARVLRQLPPGRPAIDDAAALAEADRLLATGAAKTRRAALYKVARTIAVHGNPRSVYERLRRKSVEAMKKGAT